MHPNHEYLLDVASGFTSTNPGCSILDFGCGTGATVVEGRRRGLDIVGVDRFYEGASRKTDALRSGVLGTSVLEMADDHIPFPDDTFDFVMANEVFEHVEHLTPVVHDIGRVLKPEGTMIAIFPSREVIREGHIGIPLVHRLPRGRLRLGFTELMALLGLGYHRQGRSATEWSRAELEWLDRFVYYRPTYEIYRIMERQGFRVTHSEHRYLRYRLSKSRLPLKRIPRNPIVDHALDLTCRLALGLVLTCVRVPANDGAKAASKREVTEP
ncbi:MAG: methyltransferase domain-containing protein [Actinomycetota bacterium]